MNQLAARPSYEYILKIVRGPDKGASFKILSAQVTIGRDSDNNIKLNDKKVSRKHAVIKFVAGGAKIQELSEHNRMAVDGKKTKQAPLTDHSTFLIGDTEFVFRILSKEQALTKPKKSLPGLGKSSSKSAKKSKNLLPVYFIIGGLLLFLLFSESSNKKKNTIEIRDEKAIEESIKKNEENLKEWQKQLARKEISSKDYQQAEVLYKQGFRDFEHGNYEQALTAFQACLSIFSKHELCERYQFLSKRKLDELLQYNMVLGRQYMEKNQFKQCIHAFKNVMLMVKNNQDPVYKEAESNLKICQQRFDGGF
ncbi:MAG: FHA domain-containing protein [Bdellovibrionales bacterium]|nr:FHA domain-containing protein [Bdellovibrionales bacterium]